MNENDAPEEKWWNRESYSAALSKFRDTLKQSPLDDSDLEAAWVNLGLIAHVNGHSHEAARMVSALMSRRRQAGRPIWCRGEVAAAAIIHFKLAASLAEDCGVSRSDVMEMMDGFEDEAVRHGVPRRDVDGLRLAVLVRLGELSMAGGLYPALRNRWEEDHGTESDESDSPMKESDKTVSAICGQAMAQLLVEYLILAGSSEEAMALAKRVLTRSVCGSPCEGGPHGVLAWMLLPLHEAGECEEADRLARKGRVLAPASDARHLGAAGERILYFAKTGRFGEVDEELRLARTVLDGGGATPWQRLRFAARVVASARWDEAAALNENGSLSLLASDLEEEGERIAIAFDGRNGNRFASTWWRSLMEASARL